MTLYQIIKALQTASGSNAKQAILEQNKDNELLKAYLKATYDPAISFYQKVVPKHGAPSGRQAAFDMADILHAIDTFAKRRVTGDLAKRAMQKWLEDQNSVEDQELCVMLIARSIGAGIGETLVLKTFPGLFFTVPYQRCSLLDDKAKARFAKMPLMYVQPKLDGSFMYLVKEAGKPAEAITRAGSKYPQWFADKIAQGVPDGIVLVGEALVCKMLSAASQAWLPRQEGNGILNSILKSGDDSAYGGYDFYLTAWDLLLVKDFYKGKSSDEYIYRLTNLQHTLEESNCTNVHVINNFVVKTLEEAYTIYSEHTARGGEGCVLKSPDSAWSNGTSKDMVKMKIAFEIDLEITGMKEGTGKAKNMLGALTVQSSDGLLQCDVGTGFSDLTRQQFWDGREDLYGMIVSVKANDILANRANENMSLFLPVFVEVRVDKKIADSYDECLAQLDSAKGLK